MDVFFKVSKSEKVYATILLGFAGDVTLDVINTIKKEGFEVIQIESTEYYRLKTQLEFDHFKNTT